MKTTHFISPQNARYFTLVVGLCLVVLALAADWLGLGASTGFGQGQKILMFFGSTLFLLGLAARTQDWTSPQAFGKRVQSLYSGIAILILNTLLIVLLLETGSMVVLRVLGSHKASTVMPDPIQEWEAVYQREFAAADRAQYYPYVIWRNVPSTGSTLEISADGIRRTPGANCQSESYRVFAFGGSTMWGVGAPDWSTIPAYLQAGLEDTLKQGVCVINFGQKGYVSTQELIELTIQLQQGNVPDLVIFYDGSNDITAGYLQSGVPNPHIDLSQVKFHFEHPFYSYLSRTWTMKLFQRFLGESHSIESVTPVNEKVLQTYLGTYQLVKYLAENYGFKFAFFWQPVIMVGNKPLTSNEQNIDPNIDLNFLSVYQQVYGEMMQQSKNLPHLYYLGGVFDTVETQTYTDFVHLTPEGNQIVAEVMLAAIINASPNENP
jgi:lysophospholipase L1-like esterase